MTGEIPGENLTHYKAFVLDGETYYFTAGGFLYGRTRGRTRSEVSSVATSPTGFGTIEPTTDRLELTLVSCAGWPTKPSGIRRIT